MLDSGDLGHRVVVRYRTDAGPTDVLGELTSMDDHGLVVRTEAGDERRIARAAVVAGKRVGPRPARYSEIFALERVAAAAWPTPETERLGEWLLRAAGGWTNRANSALPLGDAGCDLDEAVRACVAFYTARGLTPKITVPLPVRRDVARHLEAAGWIAQPEVLVQTAELDRITALAGTVGATAAVGTTPRANETAEAGGASAGVTLHDRPPPDILPLIAARKEGLPPAAEHVLTAVDPVRFAVIRDGDGGLLAYARGAIVEGPAPGTRGTAGERPTGSTAPGTDSTATERGADRAAPTQRWLHLGLVEVLPPARRRGFGRAVSVALAEWARQAGATRGVLQVEAHNEPARRLYESLGWRTHHSYVTYRHPAA
jgi:GNAT superfamily N-acetyltransferase